MFGTVFDFVAFAIPENIAPKCLSGESNTTNRRGFTEINGNLVEYLVFDERGDSGRG